MQEFITNSDIVIFAGCAAAIYERTMRGKDQVIYMGQPFIFDKYVQLTNGIEKRIWRCNQWWNKKCRARIYTIGDLVTPINKLHTHADIIKRKKRTTKKRVALDIDEAIISTI